jgi:hypothetical protein
MIFEIKCIGVELEFGSREILTDATKRSAMENARDIG